MRRYQSLFVLVGFALAATASANDKGPSKAKLGEKIANLTFQDRPGQEFGPARPQRQEGDRRSSSCRSNARCPTATAQPLADMAKEFGKHGVAFVGLTTNEDDTPAEVAKHVQRVRPPLPRLPGRQARGRRRAQGRTSRPRCSSSTATSSSAIAAASTTATRSASRSTRRSPDTTCSQVLGELLAGPAGRGAGDAGRRLPHPARSRSRWPRTARSPTTATCCRSCRTHCQGCHRPGEVGPFSLMTYKQAVNWADDIKSYTQNRKMPPWKPAEGVPFHNERRLTRQGDRHAGRLGRRRHARRATRRTRRRRASSPRAGSSASRTWS